jgi:prefoldin subunit 5
MTVPFNEALHPRAGGGRFGVSNRPKVQPAGRQPGGGKGRNSQLRSQIANRVRDIHQRVHELRLQLASIDAQIASLRKPAQVSHTTKKKSTSSLSSKGSKPGITAKKMSTKRTTKATKSKPQLSANQQQIQSLSGKAGTIRMQIHLLNQRASQLQAQSRKL